MSVNLRDTFMSWQEKETWKEEKEEVMKQKNKL